jgi:UPF0716 protein FxsA
LPILFLLFIIVPIIEISLFIQIGGKIGGFNTLALVIVTAALGAFCVKREGIATLQSAQQKLQQNQMPAKELIAGAGLLVAGVLLITPGFMTDLFGFLLILPFSRKWLLERLLKRSNIAFTSHHNDSQHTYSQHQHSTSNHTGDAEQGNVFEGEYTDHSGQNSKASLINTQDDPQTSDEKKL